MTFEKISSAFPGLFMHFPYEIFIIFICTHDPCEQLSTSSPLHVTVTFLCLKIKWSFPKLNPHLTEMPELEGNSGWIQITFLCVGEKLPVFPLDRFACCAAIFVLLTLISTYEAACGCRSASGHNIFQNTTVFFEHNKFLQSSSLITDFHWFVSRVEQHVLYKCM